MLEDLITAVVSDSSESQIEATIQPVLQDIAAMEFGYGDHLQLDTNTDNMDKDRQMVATVDAMVHLVSETLSSVQHVQPGDASLNGKLVLRCREEKEGMVIPTEGSFEARIMLEVLDGELDPEVKPGNPSQ